jgi:hypothetical protein
MLSSKKDVRNKMLPKNRLLFCDSDDDTADGDYSVGEDEDSGDDAR